LDELGQIVGTALVAIQLTETHQSILIVASGGLGLCRALFQYALVGLLSLLRVVLCLLLCFGDAGGVVLLRHGRVRRECLDGDVVEKMRVIAGDGAMSETARETVWEMMRWLVVWMIELVLRA
jgi:hypothetical protein